LKDRKEVNAVMLVGRLCHSRFRCAAVFRFKKFKRSVTNLQQQPKPKLMFTEIEVLQVMQLGYTRSVAVQSLKACDGDVNKACNLLLECGLVSCQPYFGPSVL